MSPLFQGKQRPPATQQASDPRLHLAHTPTNPHAHTPALLHCTAAAPLLAAPRIADCQIQLPTATLPAAPGPLRTRLHPPLAALLGQRVAEASIAPAVELGSPGVSSLVLHHDLAV